jgi:hypothetical protein
MVPDGRRLTDDPGVQAVRRWTELREQLRAADRIPASDSDRMMVSNANKPGFEAVAGLLADHPELYGLIGRDNFEAFRQAEVLSPAAVPWDQVVAYQMTRGNKPSGPVIMRKDIAEDPVKQAKVLGLFRPSAAKVAT